MGIQDKDFRGVVVPGRGFGAQRMANPTVLQAAQRLTDLTLVPGTLNVRLPQPFNGRLPWYLTEADLGGNVWRDHAPNRTGIRCGKVIIAGRYRGMVFQGDEPEYPPAQGEILSDHHLRDTLGVHDGDMLAFSLVFEKKHAIVMNMCTPASTIVLLLLEILKARQCMNDTKQ
jgi:CTP-dependent riboflavin kinase